MAFMLCENVAGHVKLDGEAAAISIFGLGIRVKILGTGCGVNGQTGW
jgi:hypothetical protein